MKRRVPEHLKGSKAADILYKDSDYQGHIKEQFIGTGIIYTDYDGKVLLDISGLEYGIHTIERINGSILLDGIWLKEDDKVLVF